MKRQACQISHAVLNVEQCFETAATAAAIVARVCECVCVFLLNFLLFSGRQGPFQTAQVPWMSHVRAFSVVLFFSFFQFDLLCRSAALWCYASCSLRNLTSPCHSPSLCLSHHIAQRLGRQSPRFVLPSSLATSFPSSYIHHPTPLTHPPSSSVPPSHIDKMAPAIRALPEGHFLFTS